MRSIVFDASPLISLTLNNLLYLLKPLKDMFKGEFYITDTVKSEIVDSPIKTKRFEFEALQALHCIEEGTLKTVRNKDIEEKTEELLDLANNIFKAKGTYIRIVHKGEVSSIAAGILLSSDALVVDERTARLLIENPHKLKNILEHRLNMKIEVNNVNLKRFREITKNIRLIRSVELVTIAFEAGLVDKYVPSIPDGKRILLEALLWGVKLDGCSVSKSEINQIIRIERLQ